MYAEDQFLMLSGIQHFFFCKRQWALIHLEQQWAENYSTVEGEILHERADKPMLHEKRGGIFYSRAMPVSSATLGLSGILDVVLFEKDEAGISLPHRRGKWRPYVIEYKRGKQKPDNRDKVQLGAEVMCLEEKLGIAIDASYLYYFKTNRRINIPIDLALREEVKRLAKEMHDAYASGKTPVAGYYKHCALCSLRDVCLPRLTKKKRSVHNYLYGVENEETVEHVICDT